MKSMFTSLNGAVTLTLIALLAELARAFVDFEWEYSIVLNSAGAVLLGALLYTAVFGMWAWALLRAARGQVIYICNTTTQPGGVPHQYL